MNTATFTSATSNPIKDNIDGTLKSKMSVDDNQLKTFVEGSGDNIEIQELKEEVQDLVDDEVYNDFIIAIAKENPLNGVEEGEKDEEFVPISTVTTDTVDTPEKECGSDVSGSEGGADSSSEDSEDSNIDPQELKLLQNEVPVAIPKDSLMAKQERYPFFWRYKHAVRNVTNEGDEANQDPDYIPEDANDAEKKEGTNGERSNEINEKNDVESDSSSASSSDGEDLNEEEIMEEESQLKEEMQDLQKDLKGLVDMVEDMSFVHDSSNHAEDVKETENEDKEEDNSDVSEEGESPTNYVGPLDDSNYNEEEDPDYKPEEDLFYAVVQKGSEDLSDSSSSSSFIADEADMIE